MISLFLSNTGCDSDLSSILLLLQPIPPSAQGRKIQGEAERHLMFKEVCVVVYENWKSNINNFF